MYIKIKTGILCDLLNKLVVKINRVVFLNKYLFTNLDVNTNNPNPNHGCIKMQHTFQPQSQKPPPLFINAFLWRENRNQNFFGRCLVGERGGKKN